MREFRDLRGREWRAWQVVPEAIQPQTKAEDYLAGCYKGGWLVFETLDGSEKRRLCPLPYEWEQRSDADLVRLLDRAEGLRPIRKRRKSSSRHADLPPHIPPAVATQMPRDRKGNLDMRYLGVVRSFLYPGGEVWRATVVAPDETGAVPVLRFASDSHVIDLTDWPADWVDLKDEHLLELMTAGQSPQDRRRLDHPVPRSANERPSA